MDCKFRHVLSMLTIVINAIPTKAFAENGLQSFLAGVMRNVDKAAGATNAINDALTLSRISRSKQSGSMNDGDREKIGEVLERFPSQLSTIAAAANGVGPLGAVNAAIAAPLTSIVKTEINEGLNPRATLTNRAIAATATGAIDSAAIARMEEEDRRVIEKAKDIVYAQDASWKIIDALADMANVERAYVPLRWIAKSLDEMLGPHRFSIAQENNSPTVPAKKGSISQSNVVSNTPGSMSNSGSQLPKATPVCGTMEWYDQLNGACASNTDAQPNQVAPETVSSGGWQTVEGYQKASDGVIIPMNADEMGGCIPDSAITPQDYIAQAKRSATEEAGDACSASHIIKDEENIIAWEVDCEVSPGVLSPRRTTATIAVAGEKAVISKWENILSSGSMVTIITKQMMCVPGSTTEPDCSPEGQAAWRNVHAAGSVNYTCDNPLQ